MENRLGRSKRIAIFSLFMENNLPRVRGIAKVFPSIDEEMVVMGSDGVPPGVEGE
jgi:hypothetical protein